MTHFTEKPLHYLDKKQIYLGEIKTQIEFAKRAYKEYLEALEESEVFSVFYHAHHFLIHSMNVDKLIDVDENSFRGRATDGLFSSHKQDLGEFRRLRNHLEHFDERLDKWVRDYFGHAFFDMNIVTGAKGFPKEAFLRAIDGDLFRFHGENYDLARLYRKLLQIENHLFRQSD